MKVDGSGRIQARFTGWAAHGALALALALAAAWPGHAQAANMPIAADSGWYTFDVDPLTSLSNGKEWIDLDGSALVFELTLLNPAYLTVVDAGFAGDVFEVFVNGASLGTTSPATNSYPVSVGLNFAAAMADLAFSRGSYLLAPGSYAITGVLSLSALDDAGSAIDATVGGVRVRSVAEPGSLALLLAGIGFMGIAVRRRCNV
jgi:hypothetical protein